MIDIEKITARARYTLISISVIGAVVLLGGALLTVAVVTHAANKPGPANGDWIAALGLAEGPITLAAIGLLIAAMPWGILQVVTILLRRASDSRFRSDQLMGLMESQRQTLEQIRDIAALSDAAKQVTHRAKDLEALRAAIREDIDKGDFEAATMLVSDMEQRFGYAFEADNLREQINEQSRAAIDRRVQESVDHVEMHLSRHEWDDATRESDRINRLYPNHAEARKLTSRIATARDDHKRSLLKSWKDSVAKDDVDRSVELLRQLDQYLSPSEAEAHKEIARDVFRKRLAQLGVQFAMLVHDRSWAEALRTGKQITDEFPNTRMAAEVRERLPILEEKAQQPAAV